MKSSSASFGNVAAAVALVCRSQTSFETKARVDLVTHRDFRGGSKAAIRLIVCQEVETEIDAVAHPAAPPRKPVRATAPSSTHPRANCLVAGDIVE
jgi:hypothetical protein